MNNVIDCKVIEIVGDALQNDCDVLCHQVNLAGVMGGGIALSIATRYPNVEKEYQIFEPKELGAVCYAKTKNYVIANCFSQRNDFRTDYEALGKCLDKVVAYLKSHNLDSVAIPYKYGCGIASGNWEIVKETFIKKLAGYTLKIYKLNL